jgi:two-component sensor histidine kinase
MQHGFRRIICLIFTAIILKFATLSSFSQTYQAGQSAMQSQLHERALSHFKKGDIAQGKKLFKELIDQISKPGNEKAEAGLWHELAALIPSRDSTGITRRYCFEKMAWLYKKAGAEENEIESLKSIADLNMVQGSLHLAESQLLTVLRRYKAIGYPKLYYVYDLLAVTNRYKGDFSKGIYYGLRAVESMEASHDFSSATTFYSRLANMYRELGQTEKSIQWYWKVFENRKYSESVNLYMFRDAGFLARELIKLKREKEALAFILDIKAKNKPNGVYAKASLLASLGYCYHSLRNDRRANQYYSELFRLTGRLKADNEVTTDVYCEMGQYYMNKGQYRQAESSLLKALNAAHGINSLSDTKDIHKMLYESNLAMGNYKSAQQYLMKHMVLKDSIFNEKKSRQIEELQVRYETAKKKKDIELLSSQNQQAHKIKNITLGGAVLLLIIIGLLYSRYLTKQRSNRKLEAHQKELDQKNIFLESLNAELHHLLKEKEWLIDEVHHRVKNNLQMVTSLLHTQSAYLKDPDAVMAVKDSLRRVQAMSLIHQKLYEDQNTTTIAMPEYVRELVGYLRESFETGNRLVFEQKIDALLLDVSQAVPLGLIMNEAIANSIKFAFKEQQQGIIIISLQAKGQNYIMLDISDNGIGLPPTLDLRPHESLGLDLMQGLAKQLKGTFSIETNQGVHISVIFPALK